jgi:hypothetical protein
MVNMAAANCHAAGAIVMRKSYFPSTDAKLCGWAAHLTAQLSADYAHFGLTLQQVEDLSARAEAFRAAMLAAAPVTERSQSLVARRNLAREAFKDAARRVVAIIRAQVNVGDDERVQLGLTIPSPRRRETSRPQQAPNVIVHAVQGHSVKLFLMDAETGARRKPQDVRSALIFLAVGEEPPEQGDAQWKLLACTGSANCRVMLPAHLTPGTKVWFCVAWADSKSRIGPASTPIHTRVPFDAPGFVPAALRRAA